MFDQSVLGALWTTTCSSLVFLIVHISVDVLLRDMTIDGIELPLQHLLICGH